MTPRSTLFAEPSYVTSLAWVIGIDGCTLLFDIVPSRAEAVLGRVKQQCYLPDTHDERIHLAIVGALGATLPGDK